MRENMKPSGIAWIGDIPESWNLSKIRFVTTLRTEQGLYSKNDKYIGLENISSYTGKYIETETEYETAIYDVCMRNDVLFSKLRPYLAKAMIAKDSFFCTGELAVIKKYSGDNRFLFHYLLSDGFLKMVDASTYGSKMPRASWEYIKNLQIPVLTNFEQTIIADFLDGQCDIIDSIAYDLEKQIEILQKYKKSLITETVTKGLDKTAHVKESGIDAIGLINESYVISKLKYIVVTPITDGPHETPILLDEGVPFLSAEAVRNERLEFENKRGYISEADHEMYCKKCKPQRNDIFMIKSGATTGNIALVDTDEEFSVWSPLALIRCDNILIKQKFVFYSMLSDYFSKNVELSWSYGTQQNIGMGVIGNLQVVLPSSNEQTQIVNYLDIKCKKIDSIIESKKEQLTKITQHKKSLIYEYVTGKKRVKGAHSNGN